jgi:hypothetical protein
VVGTDHFLSLDSGCEGQQVIGQDGWAYDSAPPSQQVTAIYRCTDNGSGDHFVSTDPNCEGQHAESLLGYIASTPAGATVPPPPAVSGMSPNAGPVAGGTSVTLTGSGFTGATGVWFGSNAATNVQVVSDTEILATSPAGSAGTVDVTVSGAGGTSSTGSADRFTYYPPPTVTSVRSDNGPAAGGTKVTINGTSFIAGGTVAFGSTPATGVTVVSSKQLTAIVPAGSPGSVNVRVTTLGGTSTISAKDLYAYGPPTITSFTPTSGRTGSSVTITGTAFAAGMVVMLGSLNAKVAVVSGTSLRATVTNGDGISSTLTVSDAQGSNTSTSQFSPTFAITGLSPASASVGTQIAINGIGFTQVSIVKFHGTSATSVQFVSPTELLATVPTGATTGPITVTNSIVPKGTVTSAMSFTVT